MNLEKKRITDGPLDGGWGWMIVASCFFVTFCTRAVTRCISVFFVEFQMHFGHDYARTAWIHSLVDCNTMLCAPLGSFIGNKFSCRTAVILGGFMASVGLIMSSFATSLEYLYITLGVLTGVGFALCYTPAITMVGTYFCKRKALAYGIAMSGSGIGTFLLAPAAQLLIEFYSWRGALLIAGGFVANLCVCGALMRPITPSSGPAATAPLADSKDASEDHQSCCPCSWSRQGHSFLLEPHFMVLAASFVLLASGCSLPFVYLVPYALNMGVNHQQAALLMSILGVIGIMGNITFGWLTDRRCLRQHRGVCYILAVGLEGLCCLVAPLLQSFGLLVPFAVLYGYFDGAYVALIPVVTSDVVGPLHISSALGVVYFLHAFPYLLSPPIGGWLMDRTNSYTAMFFLSGFTLLSSSLLLATAAAVRHCRRVRTDVTDKDPKWDLLVSNHKAGPNT